MSSSSNWKLCHSSNHAQHDSLFTAHRCFYFLVVFYGCCLCTCLNNQNFKPAKKAFKQGLLNQGAGTSVNVFSPPFFGGLNLFLVFGTSSHTCWWTATCPPRIPEDLCLSFSTEANWESPPPHSSRSMFNASVPQLSSWNWRYSLSVYPSVRLAASLLPSVFDMWHSGICLPSRWLPIRSFSQGACCSQEKNSTLMHPNVSVMQFSSSQGFSGVQLHPPPPLFFLSLNTLRPAVRLRAGVECVLRGDSKQRPCISGIHSCRRTCLFVTSKPPSGLSANFFSLRTTSFIIVSLSLALPKVQMLHHLAPKSPPPSPLLSSPRASAASH